jgi:hypothetical protein
LLAFIVLRKPEQSVCGDYSTAGGKTTHIAKALYARSVGVAPVIVLFSRDGPFCAYVPGSFDERDAVMRVQGVMTERSLVCPAAAPRGRSSHARASDEIEKVNCTFCFMKAAESTDRR